MGVDYVSLMARAETMVTDYEAATRTKLSDTAAEKMKTTFFDKLVEQEQRQQEHRQQQVAQQTAMA